MGRSAGVTVNPLQCAPLSEGIRTQATLVSSEQVSYFQLPSSVFPRLLLRAQVSET